MIELNVQKKVTVKAKEIQIYCKVCDNFTAALTDQDGSEICSQPDGYVPGFMPGTHYGDYLILNIDLKTGLITNWKTPTAKQITEWVTKCQGGDE